MEKESKDNIVEQEVHNYSSERAYVRPEEEAVLDHLEWFQDQKLALMMHWGIYSQPGIVESWALIDEDEIWSRNEIDWTDDIDAFKDSYVNLNKTFNPIRFEPAKWAAFAREVGFRYLIFTTKHHDGFCMWDTRTTDYKITGPDCPFHTNPRADIVRHVFDAFRSEGLGIAAYFSKADWHSPDYWKEGTLHSFTKRGPSYDPVSDPETWDRFRTYTQTQLKELALEYGPVDILWLDAGWVRPSNHQDLHLSELMEELRQKQPDLIIADRTVGGPNENYVTPEQCIPETPLSVPWESCITMGSAFSFRYEDTYKSARKVAGLLLEVIAKGGNLALNVAPQPDGRLPRNAMHILKDFGLWLKDHEEGIFSTRVQAPFAKDGYFFTRNRHTGNVYAFRYYPEDAMQPETEFLIPYDGPVKRIRCLETGEELPFQTLENGKQVTLDRIQNHPITITFELLQD